MPPRIMSKKRKKRSGISKHPKGKDRKTKRPNALVAPEPGVARAPHYSEASEITSPQPTPTKPKPSTSTQIRQLQNRVYYTQTKLSTQERSIEVLTSKNDELQDLRELDEHAREKLQTEVIASNSEKNKASNLLADRTARFSDALTKKNVNLSREKQSVKKLKAEVDIAISDKQMAAVALQIEVASRVQSQQAVKQH